MNPAQTIGACTAVIGVIIVALKLASMWGKQGQRTDDLERRVLQLEHEADGVPDAVEAEVSVQTIAAENRERMLERNQARFTRRTNNMDRRLIAIEARCAQINGPPSQVIPVDDSDELLLEPPKEYDNDEA